MNDIIHCPKCESTKYISYGSIGDRKRYKCKNCSCQFTKNTIKGKSRRAKMYALMLYLSGLSMNMVGKVVGVSRQAIMTWIKGFGKEFKLPEGHGEIVEVELDEMWHFIKKNSKSSGSGKYFVAKLGDCSAFIVASVPLRK